MPTKDERLYAGLIFGISFLTSFVGPLIIWLLKKDSPYVDHYGRLYMNYFITYTFFSIVSFLLIFILIGFLLLPIVALAALIFKIIALVRAYDGEIYEMPFIFRIF